MNGKKINLINVGLIIIFVLGVLTIFSYNYLNNDYLAKKGDYYLNECKPVELNINNGLFSAKTNKINCSGVLINIETDVYNKSISIYKSKLNESEG